MESLKEFAKIISESYEKGIDIVEAQKIVHEINTYLYASPSNIGTVEEFGQQFPYFSSFHKFWHKHHKEILDLKVNEDSCDNIVDVLHDVFIRTKGSAFESLYDTNGLSQEEICRVRLLTANQDFRGSRNFKELSDLYKSDPTIFEERFIADNPEEFVKSIGMTHLSQNDKRVQYAKRIAEFVIDNNTEPYGLINVFNNDLNNIRKALISCEGAGYGFKKTDMFLRDMVLLSVWDKADGFEKIDVASDVNTIKVALRTGILESAIPLVSSFLDIFCYQYGYVDEMNAQAWRRVWEIWRKKYPTESLGSPSLLDYFIYNVVGRNICKEILCIFKCEKGHQFYWHSSRNKTCQVCVKMTGERNKAKIIQKVMPCSVEEGKIAVEKTEFVQSHIANPNYSNCPFMDVCNKTNKKKLMPPKSISILGQTGWSSAYTGVDVGGGGLMA